MKKITLFLIAFLLCQFSLSTQAQENEMVGQRVELRLSESLMYGRNGYVDFLAARAGYRVSPRWIFYAEYLQGASAVGTFEFSQLGTIGASVISNPRENVEVLASFAGGLLNDRLQDGSSDKKFAGVGDIEFRTYIVKNLYIGSLARIIMANQYYHSSFIGVTFGVIF
ncbi:MAG: hypothetical protein IJM29_00080 [Bacteroidales bacterium]|nr:hypothetical protein [Bacteroidales bacterium]